MMTGCCDDFDMYKQGYQSIRAFSLLMNLLSNAFALGSGRADLPISGLYDRVGA